MKRYKLIAGVSIDADGKATAIDVTNPLVDLWEAAENTDENDPVIEAGMPCRSCRGAGYNAPTLALYDAFHGATGWCHALVQDEVDTLAAAGRLWEFTHVHAPETDERWIWKEPRVHVDAADVNQWSYVGFGHDTINQRICVEVRSLRMGIYGLCPRCGGEGEVFN